MALSYALHAEENEAQITQLPEAAAVADADQDEETSTEDQAETPVTNTSARPPTPQTAPGATVLPEIEVSGKRIRDQRINKTQSITTVTSRDLERTQAATIFEAVRDVPGVEVSGGPRIAGMSFNIRGFQDNADVMIKVDGVRKSFEKYRMGGTFVEPELLKSIEVQRGPQIASGSGSIGGTILMETKDAADLLAPGRTTGARIKFGYGNNNDEYMRSYTAFTRPHERVDILYNYTSRDSNNFMLPKGSLPNIATPPTTEEGELAYSGTSSRSELLKFSIFPIDSLQLTTSVVKYKDSALALYDQITNAGGSFGQVYRDIDDTSFTENIRYNPEDISWIDFKMVIAKSKTQVIETSLPGWPRGAALPRPNQGYCVGTTFYTPGGSLGNQINPQNGNPYCPGNGYEDYDFRNTAFEFSNNAVLYAQGDWNIGLLAGYQYNKSKRNAEQYYDNPASMVTDESGIIPSGTQSFHAIYLQPRLEWGRFSIIPGVRYDRYVTEAGRYLQPFLQNDGLEDEIKFRQRSTSLGINFDFIPKQFSFFANYSQGFRTPTLAHYFAYNLYCDDIRMPVNRPDMLTSVCGSLFKPQLSESTEAGFSYRTANFLQTSAEVVSKLTFYHIITKNTLRSIMEDSSGQIRQDGWERRNGVEFETAVEYKKNYLRIGYSRNSGKMSTVAYDLDSFGNNVNPHMVERAITTIPGNTLSLTLGTGAIKNIDAYISYRKVGERLYSGGTQIDATTLEQAGYEIFNAGVHYTMNQYLGFRLIGENLMNKPYNYNGSGDFADQIGLPAAGRNIRFIVEMTY